MKFVIATLMACCVISASAHGQISTSFSTGDGFSTGQTGFTVPDPNNSNFSLTFGSPGEIVFFNNGGLYDVSNRAFAVDGGQTSTITFSSLADVTVSGRDTNGNLTGGASTTVPGGTILGAAVGTVEAFGASNNSLGVFNFTDTGFTDSNPFIGATRLELTNTGPVGSFAILGSINAQASAVPEPGSAAVLGLAGLTLLRRKRS